ncbi:hypothetical protein [Actinoplanes italicus]|jgi:hypothetical protein|uniref:hypothetical protein n=1 Tax=Actinoplanes italicus TaxID=113567 RepID=UPI0011B247DA|nr:hypothetical protein [Actinoplanes italicus]
MRGISTVAVLTSTLLVITGCATSGQSVAPAATAAPAVTISGLDEATAEVCGISHQATLGEGGYDFDVATATRIVTLGKASKSTIITAAAAVLEVPVRQAQAAAGEPTEAGHLAELRTAMLKFQTICQDADALVGSIEESRTAVDSGADQQATR